MKPLSRRDILKLGGAGFLAAAFAPALRALQSTPANNVLAWGSKRQPKVALTVDDCYLAHIMQRMEKTLQANPQARVTFFPVGEALVSTNGKDPGIWKRIRDAGHDIGYHSFNHDDLATYSADEVFRDYDRWLKALGHVLEDENPKVRFARPPYGNVTPQFLDLCNQRGLVCTMWSWGWGSGIPGDRGAVILDNAKEAITNLVPKTKPGQIILMHARAYSADAETLESGIPWLAEHKLRAVTLSEMYYDLQKEEHQSAGCDVDASPSLTRTCIE